MAHPVELAETGLVGWRSKVAEQVAGPVAQRTPLSRAQARAVVGAAFFTLATIYVAGTANRMLKVARG